MILVESRTTVPVSSSEIRRPVSGLMNAETWIKRPQPFLRSGCSPFCNHKLLTSSLLWKLVMLRLGSAWKPRLKLGFFRLRPVKSEAQALGRAEGQLRLGFGLGGGFMYIVHHDQTKKKLVYLSTFVTTNTFESG